MTERSACLRPLSTLLFVASLAIAPALTARPAAEAPYWQTASSTDQEAYIEELTPPGVSVVVTALEGPVYADERGHTLYKTRLTEKVKNLHIISS